MNFTRDELRLLAVSGPTWITLLRSREERIINRIHADYRSGKTDHLAAIAELISTREQIKEIESAIKQNEGAKS